MHVGLMKHTALIISALTIGFLRPSRGKSALVRYQTNCEPGTVLATCQRNLCDDVECDGYANAECRLNVCGTCQPVFFVNNVQVYCRHDAVPRNIYFGNCPPGLAAVPCSPDTCKGRSCRNYPNAKCRFSPCDCKPIFFVNDVLVHCASEEVTVSHVDVQRKRMKPCERERRRGELRENSNRFVVNCTRDGSYKSLQCWPAVGLCWCVNRNGKEILGSRTYFPLKPKCEKFALDCRSTEFGCCPDNLTPAEGLHQEGCPGIDYTTCAKSLYGCCSDGKTSSKGPNLQGCPREPTKCEIQRSQADPAAQFRPRCKSDGTYASIQCLPFTGLCWCIDGDGQELEGTRTSGRPDCSRAICEDKREDCLLYARVPGFCNKISHYMKEYCRKSCGFCKGGVSVHRITGFGFPPRPGCGSDYGCCEDLVTPAKGRNDYLCPLYASPCHMPKMSGSCELRLKRFFFNPDRNRCQEFVYRGCHGNENNFNTKLDCEDECMDENETSDQLMLLGEKYNLAPSNTEHVRRLSEHHTPVKGLNRSCNSAFGCCTDGVTPATGPWKLDCPRYGSYCHMPAATGPCNKYLTRYFYNLKTKRCDAFVYGGCQGNKNRFATREECRSKCKTKHLGTGIGIELNNILDGGQNSINIVSNTVGKVLERRAKKDNHSEVNRVISRLRSIVSRANLKRLKQIKELKALRKSREKFFKKLSECEKREYVNKMINKFVISNRNKNVFSPTCSKSGKFSKVQCWKDRGYCWCVDVDGNEIEATRSSRLPACHVTEIPKKSCVDRSPSKCKHYGSPSYCKRYKRFMKSACPRTCGYCKEHVTRPGCRSKYGCCDDGMTAKRGDENSCPMYESVCAMPKNSGRCLGYMERFYYDVTGKECVKFIYGGCDGNANNFLTKHECEFRCNYTLFSSTFDTNENTFLASDSQRRYENDFFVTKIQTTQVPTKATTVVHKPQKTFRPVETEEKIIDSEKYSDTTLSPTQYPYYSSTGYSTTQGIFSTTKTTENETFTENELDNTIEAIVQPEPLILTKTSSITASPLTTEVVIIAGNVTDVSILNKIEYTDDREEKNSIESIVLGRSPFAPLTDEPTNFSPTFSTEFDQGVEWYTEEPTDNGVVIEVINEPKLSERVVTLTPITKTKQIDQKDTTDVNGEGTAVTSMVIDGETTNQPNVTGPQALTTDYENTGVITQNVAATFSLRTDTSTQAAVKRATDDISKVGKDTRDSSLPPVPHEATVPTKSRFMQSDLLSDSASVIKSRELTRLNASNASDEKQTQIQSKVTGNSYLTLDKISADSSVESSTNFDLDTDTLPIDQKNIDTKSQKSQEKLEITLDPNKMLFVTQSPQGIPTDGITDRDAITATNNPLNIGAFFTIFSEETSKNPAALVKTTTLQVPTPLKPSTTATLSRKINTEKIIRTSKLPTIDEEGTDVRCKLKPARGLCDDNIPRYHYNVEMKQCILFSYSGCDGNANNFLTVIECMTQCLSQQARTTALPRKLGCNSIYGCCEDHVTPAKDPQHSECPEYESACDLPVHKGPCHASITRWYYDKETLKCKSFMYGGCEANKNNFLSDLECYLSCDASSSTSKLVGTKIEKIELKEEQETRVDLYSGCSQSHYGCCSDGISIPAGPNQEGCPLYKTGCDMPKVAGTCGNQLVRYYYNMKLKQCESFMFSGCGGNMNNFNSMKECNAKCQSSVSSCRDSYNLCGPWKERGFCESSPDISGVYCKLTCDKCNDKLLS